MFDECSNYLNSVSELGIGYRVLGPPYWTDTGRNPHPGLREQLKGEGRVHLFQMTRNSFAPVTHILCFYCFSTLIPTVPPVLLIGNTINGRIKTWCFITSVGLTAMCFISGPEGCILSAPLECEWVYLPCHWFYCSAKKPVKLLPHCRRALRI